MSPAADPTPVHHSGASAPVIQIRRFGTRVLVPAEATARRYSVLEHTLEPGYVAMPLHRHAAEIKTLHGLAGRLRVRVADAVHTVESGTSLTIPAGTWHAFWNPRPDDPAERDGFGPGERAAFLAVIAPGGLEAYYGAVADLLRGTEAPVPDIREVLAVSAVHGVDVQMESLLDFVQIERVRLA